MSASTPAFQHEIADEIAFHDDGVEHTVRIGHGRTLGNEGWIDALLNAFGGGMATRAIYCSPYRDFGVIQGEVMPRFEASVYCGAEAIEVTMAVYVRSKRHSKVGYASA